MLPNLRSWVKPGIWPEFGWNSVARGIRNHRRYIFSRHSIQESRGALVGSRIREGASKMSNLGSGPPLTVQGGIAGNNLSIRNILGKFKIEINQNDLPSPAGLINHVLTRLPSISTDRAVWFYGLWRENIAAHTVSSI